MPPTALALPSAQIWVQANKALHLTAYSVGWSLAPASGSR
jgi:hypothetical protein